MSEPFLGQIQMFGFNFAPRGWAFCNGQILPIAQNTALFSLLGTTYGGNGQTTFALPDLRSRVPIQFGQGPGLSSYDLGQQSGTESTTITINQMPTHAHAFTIGATSGAESDSETPTATSRLADVNITTTKIYKTNNPPANVQMPGGNTSAVGGNQPLGILQPYLALNFCIALEGIFPSRN
jgi:microcystin-dependent protein